MQRTLLTFVRVPSAAADLETKQSEETARLKLAPAAAPKVGRPSRQERWESLLRSHIMRGEFDKLQHLENAIAPSWYKRGSNLHPQVNAETLAHEGADEQTPLKKQVGKCKTKLHLSQSVKDWFLTWSARLVTCGWTMKRCIKEAAVICQSCLAPLTQIRLTSGHFPRMRQSKAQQEGKLI